MILFLPYPSPSPSPSPSLSFPPFLPLSLSFVCLMTPPSLPPSSFLSVFDGMSIPYPPRKFLSDDDNKDDKDHKVRQIVCYNSPSPP